MKDRQETLVAENIWYSRANWAVGHSSTVVYAAADKVAPDILAKFGIEDASNMTLFRETYIESLREEVTLAQSNNCSTFVISDELLSSRCHEREGLDRLKLVFDELFSDMLIICCLRPQADLFRSAITELAKAGAHIAPDYHEIVTPDYIYYNYNDFLSRWEASFPNAAFRILPFVRPLDGNIVNSFNEALGIHERIEKSDFMKNVSLPFEAVALSNALNIPRALGNKAHPRRNLFVEEVAPGQKVTFSEDLVDVLNGRFEDSNADLIARYPDQIDEDDLISTSYSLEPTYNKIFGMSDYSEYLSWFVERNNAEVWLEKSKSWALSGLLFAESLDVDSAQNCLSEAELAFDNTGGFAKPHAALQIRKLIDRLKANLSDEPTTAAPINAKSMSVVMNKVSSLTDKLHDRLLSVGYLDQFTDLIRDVAIKIEKSEELSMEEAHDLMKLAHILRPNGQHIFKKLQQYEKKVQSKKK